MYQDLWVKGKMIEKGTRECENRYNKIKEVLNRFNKHFTVLDIGACLGYFSFRIAEDFDCTVTMIESNNEINDILIQNDNKQVKLINKKVTVEDMRNLQKSQHFDVVLALSVLHHFEDYEDVIDTIFDLGDLLFIEPSASEEAKGGYNSDRVDGIRKILFEKQPKILTYTKNLRKLGERPLMLFDNKNKK